MARCPALAAFLPAGKAVRVAGDLMLDRFVRGPIPRQSPEAPVPILLEDEISESPGGAGVVAVQLARLGAAVRLEAVIGDDRDGESLLQGLAEARVPTDGVRVDPGGRTTVKTRFIGRGSHLLRVDREAAPAAPLEVFPAPDDGALVLSDYGKGALGDGLPSSLAAAREAGLPAVADPKPPHRDRYRGCGALTPNRDEAVALLGRDIAALEEAEVEAARELVAELDLGACVVTLGARGMAWATADGDAGRHQAAKVRELFDVTGAGDVVAAFLASGLAAGLPLPRAALVANLAAGHSVGRPDTATLSVGDVGALLGEAPAGSTAAREEAAGAVAGWRAGGNTVAFTNGNFDGLHAGHLALLAAAAAEADRLVVGINDDAAVREQKGEGRPAHPLAERAGLLCQVPFVDMVVPFAEPTPAETLAAIGHPDVLVKGADWAAAEIVGARETEAAGGRVVRVPLLEGHSTRGFLARAR